MRRRYFFSLLFLAVLAPIRTQAQSTLEAAPSLPSSTVSSDVLAAGPICSTDAWFDKVSTLTRELCTGPSAEVAKLTMPMLQIFCDRPSNLAFRILLNSLATASTPEDQSIARTLIGLSCQLSSDAGRSQIRDLLVSLQWALKPQAECSAFLSVLESLLKDECGKPAPQPVIDEDEVPAIPNETVCQAYEPRVSCSVYPILRSWNLTMTTAPGVVDGDTCRYQMTFVQRARCGVQIAGTQERCPAGCHNSTEARISCVGDVAQFADSTWSSLYFEMFDYTKDRSVALTDTYTFRTPAPCKGLSTEQRQDLLSRWERARYASLEANAQKEICEPAFREIINTSQSVADWNGQSPPGCEEGDGPQEY